MLSGFLSIELGAYAFIRRAFSSPHCDQHLCENTMQNTEIQTINLQFLARRLDYFASIWCQYREQSLPLHTIKLSGFPSPTVSVYEQYLLILASLLSHRKASGQAGGWNGRREKLKKTCLEQETKQKNKRIIQLRTWKKSDRKR